MARPCPVAVVIEKIRFQRPGTMYGRPCTFILGSARLCAGDPNTNETFSKPVSFKANVATIMHGACWALTGVAQWVAPTGKYPEETWDFTANRSGFPRWRLRRLSPYTLLDVAKGLDITAEAEAQAQRKKDNKKARYSKRGGLSHKPGPVELLVRRKIDKGSLDDEASPDEVLTWLEKRGSHAYDTKGMRRLWEVVRPNYANMDLVYYTYAQVQGLGIVGIRELIKELRADPVRFAFPGPHLARTITDGPKQRTARSGARGGPGAGGGAGAQPDAAAEAATEADVDVFLDSDDEGERAVPPVPAAGAEADATATATSTDAGSKANAKVKGRPRKFLPRLTEAVLGAAVLSRVPGATAAIRMVNTLIDRETNGFRRSSALGAPISYGHTVHTERELCDDMVVDAATLRAAMHLLLVKYKVLVDCESLGLAGKFALRKRVRIAESSARSVAAVISNFEKRTKSETQAGAVARVKAYLEKTGGVLDDTQTMAVANCLSKPCVVVTGMPGTGKTTLMRTFAALAGPETLLCVGPTAAAAEVLSGAVGTRAFTMDLVRCTSKLETLVSHIKRVDTVVVDEGSMVNATLWCAFLRHVLADEVLGKQLRRIIMLGDMNQIPSIGPGNVLRDMFRCDASTGVQLTTIYRTKSKEIATVCKRIIEGNTRFLENAGGAIVGSDSPLLGSSVHAIPVVATGRADDGRPRTLDSDFVAAMDEAFNTIVVPHQRSVLFDPATTSAMAWRRSTTAAMNATLKAKHLHGAFGTPRAGVTYPGQVVRFLENRRDMKVYNGMVGRVDNLAWVSAKGKAVPIEAGEGMVMEFNSRRREASRMVLAPLRGDQFAKKGGGKTATKAPGKVITWTKDASPHIVTDGYAWTVHTAQGQQFRYVMLAVNYYMSRKLLYTGASRAEDVLILLVPDGGMRCVKDSEPRHTLLRTVLNRTMAGPRTPTGPQPATAAAPPALTRLAPGAVTATATATAAATTRVLLPDSDSDSDSDSGSGSETGAPAPAPAPALAGTTRATALSRAALELHARGGTHQQKRERTESSAEPGRRLPAHPSAAKRARREQNNTQ